MASKPGQNVHVLPGATSSAPAAPSHWQRLDLATLDTWPVPPSVPIVDRVIMRGSLVYVGAETQTGKTLLLYHAILRFVHGGKLFDRYLVTPVERVGYLVLEDPARRVKDRFLDLRHEFPATPPNACVLWVAPGFTLTDEKFKAWLEDRIVTEGWQVLVLDTYQKATPGLNSFDDEAQSLILHWLLDLTRQHDLTIIVIDHLRKATGGRRREITMDDLKGTGGKAQNADAVILLARSPDRQTIRFQAWSKDYDEPVRILLRVAPKGSADPKFTYVGDLDALGAGAQAKGAATRAKVLAALTTDWGTAAALATALGLSKATVARHLAALVATGDAEVEGTHKYQQYRRVSSVSSTQPVNETQKK